MNKGYIMLQTGTLYSFYILGYMRWYVCDTNKTEYLKKYSHLKKWTVRRVMFASFGRYMIKTERAGFSPAHAGSP